MPIYSTRDLIPFVNQLEQKIIELNSGVQEWNANKYKLISASGRVDNIYSTSMMALVRADEAMAELGTATFKSTANRGKRLEDTLNKLRAEMYEIAATVEGAGGGGDLTEGMFFDELNNAIASVDPTIENGLKLDYRLREITDMASTGIELAGKTLYMPYKHEVITPTTRSFTIFADEGVTFIEAEITVLSVDGIPFLDENYKIITGTVSETGQVILSSVPPESYIVYFPVKMEFKDIPQDFLYLFMQQVIQKNSRIMEIVLGFENQIENIVTDIEYMKGVQWTPDFSIMRNHQDLVKEAITPKGLNVEVKDGMAHVTFSYNEHPNLSHFILERWNEADKEYVPYDGINGIVNR